MARRIMFGSGITFLGNPFLDGFASVFDLSGSLHRPIWRVPPHMADAYAMWSAWASVGDTMRSVMQDYPPERLLVEDTSELERV